MVFKTGVCESVALQGNNAHSLAGVLCTLMVWHDDLRSTVVAWFEKSRMQIAVRSSLVLLFAVSIAPTLGAKGYCADAEALSQQGGIKDYQQCIGLYLKALRADPGDYEAKWKCARTYREYGKAAKKLRVAGWKDICARCGKEGMKWAEKAIDQEPDKPDGYYYYGVNAGIYAEGVSMFTAFRQGLRGKVQRAFEKVYELDKMYEEGDAILALGRYWAVVPWPFKDRKKALRYYREYQATPYFTHSHEAQLYLAELLLELNVEAHRAEATALLERVSHTDNEDYHDEALRLLAEIEGSRPCVR